MIEGDYMKILKSILSSLKNDAPIEEVRRGLHWNAVVSTFCGLGSAMSQEACCTGNEQGILGLRSSFTEMSALELAQYCLSDDVGAASLGIAAINSLVSADAIKYSGIDGLDLVYEVGKGKNISVIGHFPYLDRLSTVARNLWIIEKHPQPGDITEEGGKDVLPRSDIVVISGTTLINHTLEGILDICKKESVRMLLGPSTPMTPVLFDYGIDILSGSTVTDKTRVLKSVSEGASFMRLKKAGGVQFVSMVKDQDEIRRKLAGQS
jgi:uncharacterized protein